MKLIAPNFPDAEPRAESQTEIDSGPPIAGNRRDQSGVLTSLLICLAFFLIALVRLGLPEMLYYDEPWYVVAAINFLKDGSIENREHPMLAKQFIVLFYWNLGGSWVSIRIGSVIFATVGLFALQMAIFYISNSRSAAAIFGILVSTNCLYFATSRMAILDPYMLGMTGISLALLARGITRDRGRNLTFVLSGAAIGLAVASKWSAAPVALFMAIATIVRFWREPLLLLRLGVSAMIVAMVTYSVTFLPLLFTQHDQLTFADFIPLHRAMAFHLSTLIGHHPYQSSWWEWPLGLGQIWLYDGKYTGNDSAIILGQNPVATLISIPAVLLAYYKILTRKDWVLGSLALAYTVCMAFWAVTHKPNMFVYHYNLPSIFALAIVAIISSRAKGAYWQFVAGVVMALHVGAFAYFYPVMSAANLHGRLDEITSHYGWTGNPNAMRERGLVGNGKEMQLWANQCLAIPSRPDCARIRRNVADR